MKCPNTSKRTKLLFIIYHVHIFNVQEMYLLIQSLFKASNHKKKWIVLPSSKTIIVLLLFQFVCTRYGVEIDIKKTSNGIVLLTLHLAFSNGKNSSDYHIAKQISTLIEYGMIHIYICVTADMNKVYQSYTLCMK